jgi:NAD+ synthase (glutamine-hydrolysing)
MNDLTKLGYYNIATLSPKVHIARPKRNMQEMISLINKHKDEAQILCFPELSLSGYTCEDLFLKEELYADIKESLKSLSEIKNLNNLIIFGMPIRLKGRVYNSGVVVYRGEIIAIVPKYYLPEYNEFYEKRWFTSGQEFMLNNPEGCLVDGVLMSTNQIVDYQDLKISLEICEDIWAPDSPSIKHSIEGAHLIVNLSASPELVGKNTLRKKMCDVHSEKTMSAYCYVSSGYLESTKDVVFAGHSFMYELGTLLGESERFKEETVTFYTVDKMRIDNYRIRNKTFGSSANNVKYNYIDINEISLIDNIYREYSPTPFLPKEGDTERIKNIIDIQSTGLKRRLAVLGDNAKVVLGLSGGLDSTLALLVALQATKPSNIYAYSFPGPGTSKNTRDNSKELANLTGINFKEISIESEVELHLKNISHAVENDITYENVQARIRTMHLFNLANKVGGLVLGTGDLSEIALGWCTFNGDHMSNYNVNASIPKTLVKHLVQYFYKENHIKDVLSLIVKTKISPELKKMKEETDVQSTEDILGPYYLHDFFLYHYIRNSFTSDKIIFIAKKTFLGKDSLIDKTFITFKTRFNKNQFKRSVASAGPKVGTVSLSPRGDWRMPDEIID